MSETAEGLRNAAQQEQTNILLETVANTEENATLVHDLLVYGADVNAQDNDGNTPLHIATKNGYVTTVKELLSHKADVRIPNKNGWTPLHFASSEGNLDAVKLLMDAGAEPLAKSKVGQTPYDLGNFFVQAVFEKYYPMPTSINAAIKSILQVLAHTKNSSHEIVTTASSILKQALKFPVQRQGVLTTGLMIERIIRDLIRRGSPPHDQASKLLSLLNEMDNYFSATFAVAKSWKLQVNEIRGRPEIQNILITMTHFQDQFIKAVNYHHVNLVVEVMSTYEDLRDEFSTALEKMDNFDKYLDDISNGSMKTLDVLKAIAKDSNIDYIRKYLEVVANDSELSGQDKYTIMSVLLEQELIRYKRNRRLAGLDKSQRKNDIESQATMVLERFEELIEIPNDIGFDFGNKMKNLDVLDEFLKDVSNRSKLRHRIVFNDTANSLQRALNLYNRQIALGNINPMEEFESRAQSCLKHVEELIKTRSNYVPKMPEIDLIESLMISSNDLEYNPDDESTLLGIGEYGKVLKGKYRDHVVAVKQCESVSKQFAKGIQTWKTVMNEPYILTLFGVCTELSNPIIITELCQTKSVVTFETDQQRFSSWYINSHWA
ncbi:hypothetical protein LEN26_004755 [Aphanomyces euteiches]|nr:hypothetical protein LEN26_004755 [Aphanomyces euteiches]